MSVANLGAALNTWLSPVLAALSPSVPFYWDIVPAGLTEYVSLSEVSPSRGLKTGMFSDDWQFNIVSRSGMTRAIEIDDAIFMQLQDFKGIKSGIPISNIAFTRRVNVSDASTGESILATEYHFNYQGVA